MNHTTTAFTTASPIGISSSIVVKVATSPFWAMSCTTRCESQLHANTSRAMIVAPFRSPRPARRLRTAKNTPPTMGTKTQKVK
jgi:hypothetical protein